MSLEHYQKAVHELQVMTAEYHTSSWGWTSPSSMFKVMLAASDRTVPWEAFDLWELPAAPADQASHALP